MKEKWQKFLAWAETKGVSKKGVLTAIVAFILGAVIF